MSRKTLVLRGQDGRSVCDRCEVADGPVSRARGLLGRDELRPGEGLLLRPSFSIHTFFMRFPIDAVFLDKRWSVLAVAGRLKPWRTATRLRARAVLELAAGEIRRRSISPGDRLSLVAPGSIQTPVVFLPTRAEGRS
jgi:uncharacterized membrane protein (UPF0127 family)